MYVPREFKDADKYLTLRRILPIRTLEEERIHSMDRAKKFNKASILFGILISSGAFAGTVMAPPEKPEPLAPGENYAESRFGAPPAKVDTGIKSGFASKQARDMDEVEDDERPSSARSPASSGGEETSVRFRVNNVKPVEAGPPKIPEGSGAETDAMVRRGVQEVALIAGDLGFFPKTVFVSRDVPVRMFVTGASKNTLCIMMDSFQVKKQVRSQRIEEITFTPGTPGKFRFYCPVNGMEGTLIVKELASIGRSTASE
jgi:plastocyanin